MNKVYISGIVLGTPTFRMENEKNPHLIIKLGIRHKLRTGEWRKEYIRLHAWHNAARWGCENIANGQIIGVQGHITQRQIKHDNAVIDTTDIIVDEFLTINAVNKADATENKSVPEQAAV